LPVEHIIAGLIFNDPSIPIGTADLDAIWMPSGIARQQSIPNPKRIAESRSKGISPLSTPLFALVILTGSVPNRAKKGRFIDQRSTKSLKSLERVKGIEPSS
jgi:hypothetical protein